MKKYPFKFLDSYEREDRGVFFGRDEEINSLYDMVFQSSIILIYGASGTGKTSLINCGLAGKFETHDWLALMIRRGNNINDSLEKSLNNAGGNSAVTSDNTNWFDEWSDNTETASTDLTPIGRSINSVYQKSFRPVYLIFDQFEELYILGTVGEQELFIKTVQDILQSKQPVKLIFSIREEYLGHLYEFERAVPQLLQKKIRIEPMNLEKVRQVIIGAAEYEDSSISIKPNESDLVAEGIFNKIKGDKKSLTIQLPFLQVFLDKFYLNITGDENRETLAEFNAHALHEMGEIGDILINFLDEQVDSIANDIQEKHPASTDELIWKILSPFSTLEGTKEPISKDQLYERLPNINAIVVDEVIERLIKSRILRYNGGTDTFEIAHDALAKPIAKKRGAKETALLEIKRLIKSQVAITEEGREYFTEKQLLFIEPYLHKLKQSDEEQDWIAKSRVHVQEQKKLEAQKQRDDFLNLQRENTSKKERTLMKRYIGALVLVLCVVFLLFNKTEKLNKEIQSYALASVAEEQVEGDPALAIRLTKMAWAKYPGNLPAWRIQRSVSKVYYQSPLSREDSLKHRGFVSSAEFSPDGTMIVSASADSTAIIRDAGSKRLIAILTGHEGALYSAVFSPKGNKIVTASEDNTAKIWKVFSPDRPMGQTPSRDYAATVVVEFREFIANLKGHRGAVFSAVFSHDGSMIATASADSTAKIWNSESGKIIADLKGHQGAVTSVAFTLNGKNIVTASEDKIIKIWDVESGNLIKDLKGPKENENGEGLKGDSLIKQLINLDYKDVRAFLGRHWSKSNRNSSPSGESALVLYEGSRFIGKPCRIDIEFIPQIEKINEYAEKADVFLYVTSSFRTAPYINGKFVDSVIYKEHLTGHAIDINVSHNNGSFANSKILRKYPNVPDPVRIFIKSIIDDPELGWGGKKDPIHIADRLSEDTVAWNKRYRNLQGLEQLDQYVDNDDAYIVVISPNGKKIAASTKDTVRIWDIKSKKKPVELKGHQGNIYSVAFSNDSNKIVTVSADNTVKIWDVKTGKLIADLKGHENRVNSAAFSPDGEKIVTASMDKTVKIWHTPTSIIDLLSKGNFPELTKIELEELDLDFIKIKN